MGSIVFSKKYKQGKIEITEDLWSFSSKISGNWLEAGPLQAYVWKTSAVSGKLVGKGKAALGLRFERPSTWGLSPEEYMRAWKWKNQEVLATVDEVRQDAKKEALTALSKKRSQK
jgi:hypothetical protein